MSRLIEFMPASLDGCIAGESDNMDWSAPDEEVSAFINDLHRPIGTYLYGRKNYETMTIWGTPDAIPGLTPAEMDFARIWQAADKIVRAQSGHFNALARLPSSNYSPQNIRAQGLGAGNYQSAGAL